MRKATLFALLAIVFLAVFLRLYPLLKYHHWETDTGEYFGICNVLGTKGYLVKEHYPGFEKSALYFPGMFYIVVETALIGNIEIFVALIFGIPVIAALSTILVFLLARRLVPSDGTALAAALFLAIVMPHVFQTSRPVPATLGDFFFPFALLLILKCYDKMKTFPLLLVTATALVLIHPLTTYFLLISVVGALLFREMMRTRSDRRLRIDIGFIIFMSCVMFAYWFTTLLPRVISEALPSFLPSWVVIPFFFIALLLVLALVWLRRLCFSWHYCLPYRDFSHQKKLLVVTCSLIVLLIIPSMVFGISDVQPQSIAVVIIFVPSILLVSFAVVGLSYIDFARDGYAVYGWLAVIGLSFLVASALHSHVLFPHRHFEVMIIPLALLVGLGLIRFFEFWTINGWRKKVISGAIISALVLGSALAAYPPRTLMGISEPGTSTAEIATVYWAGSNATISGDALIAAQNRMSSNLFGFAHLNATWYSVYTVFQSSDLAQSLAEMEKVVSPSGVKAVTHVLIDRSMVIGVSLRPWESARPIQAQVMKKFDSAPFVKLFDNAETQIYLVAWNYVIKYVPPPEIRGCNRIF